MTGNKKHPLSSVLMLLAGVALDAFAIAVFILPYDFPVTGVTGISRVINHYAGLSVSLCVVILSVLMLVIGWIFVGKRFVLSTLLASVAYPAFLAVLEQVDLSGLLLESRLLAAVFGGILTGAAIGLCVRSGGSTGGTDIIGVILNRKLHIPVAIGTYAIDFFVLAGQMLFGRFEDILYGIFLLALCSLAMNKAITWGTGNVQLFIISEHYDEINRLIQTTTHAGATLLHGKTGFLGKEEDIILCAARPKEVSGIRDLVRAVDPTAFITMSSVTQVYGRGFSMEQLLRSTDRFRENKECTI
mgnify:CR=1 FL=1